MTVGREIDITIAKCIFGYEVTSVNQNWLEAAPQGERPLRNYSKDIGAAWEVAEKMNITLIPVENSQWFAMAGSENRWKGPAEFMEFLQTGNFLHCGAAVGEEPALTICLAALKAFEHRKGLVQAPPDLLLQN